jgi:hypothetical protein
LTDRRHKVHRLIAVESNLSYGHYDFTDGYKAKPFGILVFDPPPRPFRTYTDKHGSDRVAIPGERSTLYLNVTFNKLAGKKITFTCLDHVADMRYVARHHYNGETPPNLYVETDMGGEACWSTTKSQHTFGKFWKEEKMGVLLIEGPCAGNSSGSPIERCWAGPKKVLNGLSFDDRIGTDTQAPDKQTDLTKDQMIAKDLALWKAFGETIVNAWRNLFDGGNPIHSRFTLPTVSPDYYCISFSLSFKFSTRASTSA